VKKIKYEKINYKFFNFSKKWKEKSLYLSVAGLILETGLAEDWLVTVWKHTRIFASKSKQYTQTKACSKSSKALKGLRLVTAMINHK
jgi:hypothetical protein